MSVVRLSMCESECVLSCVECVCVCVCVCVCDRKRQTCPSETLSCPLPYPRTLQVGVWGGARRQSGGGREAASTTVCMRTVSGEDTAVTHLPASLTEPQWRAASYPSSLSPAQVHPCTGHTLDAHLSPQICLGTQSPLQDSELS